jgi:hypothetical protein
VKRISVIRLNFRFGSAGTYILRVLPTSLDLRRCLGSVGVKWKALMLDFPITSARSMCEAVLELRCPNPHGTMSLRCWPCCVRYEYGPLSDHWCSYGQYLYKY